MLPHMRNVSTELHKKNEKSLPWPRAGRASFSDVMARAKSRRKTRNYHGNMRGQEWGQSWEKKEEFLKQEGSMSKPWTRTVRRALDG